MNWYIVAPTPAGPWFLTDYGVSRVPKKTWWTKSPAQAGVVMTLKGANQILDRLGPTLDSKYIRVLSEEDMIGEILQSG